MCIIFSGIQPTGIPHVTQLLIQATQCFCSLVYQLGNYLGALAHWVRLQRTARSRDTLLFSVVGWHALTLPQNPEALRASRREMIAILLAVGIDPRRSILFHQDQVCGVPRRYVPVNDLLTCYVKNPAHAELAWILSCITPLGKLKRMTTWKVCPAFSYEMHSCITAHFRRASPYHGTRTMNRKWTNRC